MEIAIKTREILRDLFPKSLDDFTKLKGDDHVKGIEPSIYPVMKNACRTCLKLLKKESTDGEKNDIRAQLSRIEMLLELFWCKMNVGHWKDVSNHWRYLYPCACLFKVVFLAHSDKEEAPLTDPEELIKICDMGMLMGEPIFDKVLARIASKLHGLRSSIPVDESKQAKRKRLDLDEPEIESYQFPNQNSSKRYEIPILIKPSIETFLREFLLPQKPLILSDIVEHWPARRLWNKDYIRKVCGSRVVPVEIGSKYTSEDWTQKLMKIETFIDKYMESSSNNGPNPEPVGYLAQHQLFHQIPELMKDIQIPEYCHMGEDPDIDVNAWFGPSSTISPLHTDPKNNLLVQVFGSKFVRLYSQSETEFLYPHPTGSMISNTSQIDLEDPLIYDKFPLVQKAKYTDILLRPGQALYIPPKCWHFVKSLSPSFSISFWFE